MNRLRVAYRLRSITLLAALTTVLAARTSNAADIVFDPTNFGANVDQVLHTLEILSRLDQQIRNQYKMLENWRFTRLEELLASMTAIRQTVAAAPQVDLAGQYPIDSPAYAGLDAEAVEALRQRWLESQRTAVLQSQALHARTVSEMPGTQARVSDYVERSNAAPGQTAVLQASNETLATLAAQLQNLQALEIAQTRTELEADAQRQAEAVFHRQRREALMRDWPTGPSPKRPGLTTGTLFNRPVSR